MPSLSSSKFETHRTCPRLYYYSYVLYLERARADGARRFGDLFHSGLDPWWRIAGQGDAPWAPPIDSALVAALSGIHRAAMNVDTSAYEAARAQEMMLGYHTRWVDLEFDLLEGQRGRQGVESWFTTDLRDYDNRVIAGWRMNGRKDAIARFDGVPRIVEHKTTSMPLDVASRYWEEIGLAMQPSIYLTAAASYLDEPVDGVLYDVARKPDIKPPMMATPVEEREYTKGKGCAACIGAAKKAADRSGVKSSGVALVEDLDAPLPVVAPKIEAPCMACGGTGWQEPPRLYAKHRDADETVDEYRERVHNEIATEHPDVHYQQVVVRRSDEQLAEARNDVAQAAREIDASVRLMAQLPNDRAHLAWGRNPKACLAQFGRRCDFIDTCPQGVDPRTSPLYSIKAKQGETK